MESKGGDGPAVAETAGVRDGRAPARSDVGGVPGGRRRHAPVREPAAIALGAVRLQVEQLAAGIGGMAAVLGVVKPAAALCAVAARWWSGHAARLAAARAVEPLLR